jgi:hypothetical protein
VDKINNSLLEMLKKGEFADVSDKNLSHTKENLNKSNISDINEISPRDLVNSRGFNNRKEGKIFSFSQNSGNTSSIPKKSYKDMSSSFENYSHKKEQDDSFRHFL